METARPTSKSHDLHLGSIRIGMPVVQAALSGYSDWPMRVIARRLGAPYTLCEVMLDRFVVEVSRGGKARQYLHVTDEEHPVGGQLMGAEPADFAPATERLVESGFDVIDINFGWPGEESARPLSGWISPQSTRCGTPNREPGSRSGTAARSGHREDAARNR